MRRVAPFRGQEGYCSRALGVVNSGVLMQELVRGIWPATALRELWAYRVLVRALVDRNLKLRYQRTILGVFWALLNPA